MVSLAGCDSRVTWNGKTKELVLLSMVNDVSDMYKYVGMVDYVFVGTVEENINNVLPKKIKDHEDYYSSYKIHVDKNLKGELAEDIVAFKMGGLVLSEIFDNREYTDSLLEEYLDYCDNEITFDRERFISKYAK